MQCFLKGGMVLGALALGLSANAGPLGLANDFNAVVFGDWNSNGGHSDGSVAIQGNAKGNYEFKQRPSPQVPTPNFGSNGQVGVVVGGNKWATGVMRTLNGNAYVGGTRTGDIQVNNGFQLRNAGSDTNTLFVQMYQRAVTQGQLMAALTGITLPTANPNNLSVNLGAGRSSGQRFVYNVDSSALGQLKTLDIQNLRNDDTIVFNVRGDDRVTWAWSVNAPTYSGIIWNFIDAKAIDVNQRQFNGTLFAPKSSLIMRQNIEGNVLVSSMDIVGGPELHFGNKFQFQGDVPVPEPATLIALAAGIGALARKRRRA